MRQRKHHSLLVVTLKVLMRRKVSSTALICSMIVLSLSCVVLCRLQQHQEDALAEMIDSTNILCTVSNSRGSGLDHLDVFSSYVDMLVGLRHERGCYIDRYVKDIRAQAIEKLNVPAGTELYRIYSLDSDEELCGLSKSDIVYDRKPADNEFSGNQLICFISEDLIESTVMDEAGTTWISVTSLSGKSSMLEVIGVIDRQIEKRIYCPFYANLSNNESEAFLISSCSFYIRDNSALADAKAELYQFFIQPDPAETNDPTIAGLIVNDQLYLQSLKEIEGNLLTISWLFPILILSAGIISFLSAYLSNRGRKKEFSVMRCLGLKRGEIFGLAFAEQSILSSLGCVIGLLFSLLFSEFLSWKAIGILFVLLLVDLLGASVSAFQVSRGSVMILMRGEEENVYT